jgi:hypothetical protein
MVVGRVTPRCSRVVTSSPTVAPFVLSGLAGRSPMAFTGT